MPKPPKELSEEEKVIVEIVRDSNGLKSTELVVKAVESGVNNPVEVLTYLIRCRQLVEVEYELPHMNYRLKSFILPAGTKISLSTEGDTYR